MEELGLNTPAPALWRYIWMALQKEMRDCHVPFWKESSVFRQLCDRYFKTVDGMPLSGWRFLRPSEFVVMARDATRIPIVRPGGADDESVRKLAKALCLKVAFLMRDTATVQMCGTNDDDFIFRMRRATQRQVR